MVMHSLPYSGRDQNSTFFHVDLVAEAWSCAGQVECTSRLGSEAFAYLGKPKLNCEDIASTDLLTMYLKLHERRRDLLQE